MEALQRLHNRGSISTGYDIDNSVKLKQIILNDCIRAGGSGGGNRQTWTLSLWVKRTELGLIMQYIWGAGTGGTNFFLVRFESDNTMLVSRMFLAETIAVYSN